MLENWIAQNIVPIFIVCGLVAAGCVIYIIKRLREKPKKKKEEGERLPL